MVESEHGEALEDTERLQGRGALVNNVKAASALAGAIRSTLGPKGLNKMLVEADGSSIVTNDGVTVLENANVEHPTAKMLIQASSSQDRAARDGTTTTIILASEMLQNAMELVSMGVHPSVIVNGYSIALREAIEEAKRIARAPGKTGMGLAVRTALEGKGDTRTCDFFAKLAMDAAQRLAQEGGGEDFERLRVKRIQVSEGEILDSELVDGLILPKSRVDIHMPDSINGGLVAILDGELEQRSLEISASIEIDSPGALSAFHEKKIENLRSQIGHLAKLGVDLLVVRDGIADEAINMLTSHGITAYRRFERPDLELLSVITGAKISRNIMEISPNDLGDFSNHFEKRISDVKHTIIEGSKGTGMTVVVRGTSKTIREEGIRIFDDGLGVAHRLIRNPDVLPGGGASYAHLSRYLRSFALSCADREQLAIEAFASALESIPRVLAENSGRDPVDVLLSLSAEQNENGPWIGFDLELCKSVDMWEAGVLDSLFVVTSSLSGASEAAISVLRIDDILWAKTEIGTPDWNNELGDNQD